MLVIVSLAWLVFWIAGLPDYYRQYSIGFMILFDLAILLPIWFFVYEIVRRAKQGRGLIISFWKSFYISVPLFIYDLLYYGVHIGHGASFLWKYWYLRVYYILPWLLIPPMGWLVEKNRKPTW
jgi:hypothetical protein